MRPAANNITAKIDIHEKHLLLQFYPLTAANSPCLFIFFFKTRFFIITFHSSCLLHRKLHTRKSILYHCLLQLLLLQVPFLFNFAYTKNPHGSSSSLITFFFKFLLLVQVSSLNLFQYKPTTFQYKHTEFQRIVEFCCFNLLHFNPPLLLFLQKLTKPTNLGLTLHETHETHAAATVGNSSLVLFIFKTHEIKVFFLILIC